VQRCDVCIFVCMLAFVLSVLSERVQGLVLYELGRKEEGKVWMICSSHLRVKRASHALRNVISCFSREVGVDSHV
jgi:hypothetical protein